MRCWTLNDKICQFDVDDAVRRTNFTIICFSGGTCGLLAFGFYYAHGVPFTAPLITLMCLTAMYFPFPLLLKTKLALTTLAVICFLCMELILFTTAVNFGGFSSPVWPWFGAEPILSYYYLRGSDRIIVLGALVFGLLAMVGLVVGGYPIASPIPEDQLPMVYFGSALFAIIFIGSITHVFTTLSRQSYLNVKAAKMLAQEKQFEAEAANTAKTQFLANMSHEFRTPLNAIIGFSDLVQQEKLGPIGNAKYLEYIADINSSSRHLLELIDDTLSYSQLDVDKYRIKATLIDVRAIVHDVIKQVRFRPEVEFLSLEAEFEENLPLLSADPRAIKQVLINLLVNAMKFTGEGGKVTISATVDSAGAMSLIVRDTGEGIPEQDLKKVTEPFFQSRQGRSTRADGTGLGLSIAREFMTLHCGELRIDSVLGAGTVVTCTFPQWRSFEGDGNEIIGGKAVS